MKNIKFFESFPLTTWAHLMVDANRTRGDWFGPNAFQQTIRAFASKLTELGITIGPPVRAESLFFDGRNNHDKIDNIIKDRREK